MAIYVKYTTPSAEGNVTAKGFEKQFEISSFQFGVGRGIGSPTGSSSDREASTPSVSEVVVTKALDNASSTLFKEGLSGEGKATAVLSFVRTDKDGGKVYFLITLSNVMVSGYSVSSGGDRPTESVSLNFTKIELKFTPVDATGTDGSPVPVTYDLGLQQLS
jgi:type VI secretion system secreted protein Hcp